jgi:hypothetical protein
MRRVRELQRGVWHWESRHPGWTPEESGSAGWGPEVSSYALDTGERLLLFDPLAPPNAIDGLVATRETAIVVSAGGLRVCSRIHALTSSP